MSRNRDAAYQDAIFESMARTLWLLAYADWAENEGEDGDEDDEQERPTPGPGGDWDDVAPETPIAALQAAHEFGELIAAANHLDNGKPNHPLAQLFYQAATIHLGVTFPLYDEPWHSQIAADPNDKHLRMVYADWLEVQGRGSDAEYVRGATGKQVADFTGYTELAERFGSDLAYMALGHGVSWSDNHVTERGTQKFDPEMPHGECMYDGTELSWWGSVDDKDLRPSSKSGNTQARYEAGGYDEPGITRTDEIGQDMSSQGMRQIIYVNQNDANFYKHSYVLWFGADYLLIWASSLQDALDEGIDWLVDNRPGEIIDDYLAQEFQREKTERETELGRELNDDEMNALQEEVEVDTTTGGNYSNHIASDAWGIVAEDPSETDLLRIAGLTRNPDDGTNVRRSLSDVAMGLVDLIPNARKKKPKPPPPSPYDELATLMFRNTITARMLRELADRGQMPQADFMRNYMTRCERSPTKWSKAGEINSSSFQNNFGRYVIGSSWGAGGWSGTMRVSGVPRVIRASAIPPKATETRSAYRQTRGQGPAARFRMLHWAGPTIDELIEGMTPAKRQWAYENLERQLLEPRATDNAEQTERWINRLRGPRVNPGREVLRAKGGRAVVATRSRARSEVIS